MNKNPTSWLSGLCAEKNSVSVLQESVSGKTSFLIPAICRASTPNVSLAGVALASSIEGTT